MCRIARLGFCLVLFVAAGCNDDLGGGADASDAPISCTGIADTDCSDGKCDPARWAAESSGVERADQLLDRIEEALRSLAELPLHGHLSPELERIGLHDCREVLVPPYRAVYDVAGRDVRIHLVADGRRNLAALHAHRLLR